MIALTADLQFDAYYSLSDIDPATGLTTRLLDMVRCFEWIVDTAVKRKATALYVLGDIFNNRLSIDLPVLHAVCQSIASAAKRIPITVIPGNHDSYLRSPKITSLSSLLGAASVVTEPCFGNAVAMCPWYGDVDEFTEAIDVLSQSKIAKNRTLLTHALIGGVVAGGKGVPLHVLKPNKFRRVFLGDVHDPIELSPTVRYVGSPMQIDYRDVDGKRGFILYEPENDRVEFVENTSSPRFWVVDSSADVLPKIGPRDFVRVVRTSGTQSRLREVVEHVQTKIGARVTESPSLESKSADARIDFADAKTDALKLERYVRHALRKQRTVFSAAKVSALVKHGLEFLNLATDGGGA